MSNQAVTWALEFSKAKTTDKFVLVCIAWHVSGDSGTSWPGIATLARETNASEPGVRASIERLIELGELSYESGDGGRGKPGLFYMSRFMEWLERVRNYGERVIRVSKGETKGKERVSGEELSTVESSESTIRTRTITEKNEEISVDSTGPSEKATQELYREMRKKFKRRFGRTLGPAVLRGNSGEKFREAHVQHGEKLWNGFEAWMEQSGEFAAEKLNHPIYLFIKDSGELVIDSEMEAAPQNENKSEGGVRRAVVPEEAKRWM